MFSSAEPFTCRDSYPLRMKSDAPVFEGETIEFDDQSNLHAYVENDPVNSTDPSGTERICVQVPSGPGQVLRCVWVDGDNDGNADEDDMSESEAASFRNDFAGFIARHGGRLGSPTNLTTYGLAIGGPLTRHEATMARVTSQFVGAGLSLQNLTWASTWRQTTIQAKSDRGFFGSLIGETDLGTMRLNPDGTYTMSLTGQRAHWFSSIYSHPSDLARIMLHETIHGSYPFDLTYYQHHQLDSRAREWLGRLGLGGGGCSRIGSYPGC
jgi:hypothetical protein